MCRPLVVVTNEQNIAYYARQENSASTEFVVQDKYTTTTPTPSFFLREDEWSEINREFALEGAQGNVETVFVYKEPVVLTNSKAKFPLPEAISNEINQDFARDDNLSLPTTPTLKPVAATPIDMDCTSDYCDWEMTL